MSAENGHAGDYIPLAEPEVGSSSRKSHASTDSVAQFHASGNRNVRLAIAFTFLAGTARGVWSFAVLSGYLYVLTGSNADVGVAEGCQGIAQLFVALLAGVLIDRFRSRERVLRLAGGMGVVGAAVLAAAVTARSEGPLLRSAHGRFLLITTGLSLFGSYQGLWNTALETIFADSIPTGHRQKALTEKFGATLVASISGPLLANGYFYVFRADEWTLPALRDVFVGGVLLCVPPMFLLCLFRDADCLGASADAVDTAASDDDEQQHFPPAVVVVEGGLEAEVAAVDDDDDDDDDGADDDDGGGGGGGGGGKAERQKRANGGVAVRWYVLRVTVLNDLVSGLGSGMSVKFMPLFFKNRLRLAPTEVNWIMVAAPLVMAAGSWAARLRAKRLGRARVTMAFGLTGATAMVALGLLPNGGDGGGGRDWARDWRVCVPLYFLSCAQHCCRPLKKSILMDFSERRHRGGWNAVDSITRFGWSGSAVVGGFLIDSYSYQLNFAVTGAMLAVAALLWPLIFAHVDRADGLHSPLGASLSLSPSSSSMSTSASAMPSSSRGGKKHGKKNAVTTGSRRSLSAPLLDS